MIRKFSIHCLALACLLLNSACENAVDINDPGRDVDDPYTHSDVQLGLVVFSLEFNDHTKYYREQSVLKESIVVDTLSSPTKVKFDLEYRWDKRAIGQPAEDTLLRLTYARIVTDFIEADSQDHSLLPLQTGVASATELQIGVYNVVEDKEYYISGTSQAPAFDSFKINMIDDRSRVGGGIENRNLQIAIDACLQLHGILIKVNTPLKVDYAGKL